mgnify:FL=1
MTKDIMRAAIARGITEAKENNIKFINKMDRMIAVIQEIKYEALCSQAQMDAFIRNIDSMESLQLSYALSNTISGVLNIQDKINKSGDKFAKILEE